MKATVIGIRKDVNFEDQQTGKVVSGASFFIGYPDDYVDGMTVKKCFVTSQRLSGLTYFPRAGEEVQAEFNAYGKLHDIRQV